MLFPPSPLFFGEDNNAAALEGGGNPFSLDDIAWNIRVESHLETYQDTAKTTPATADNADVGAWGDSVGSGIDLIQATTKPVLKLNIVNGYPVLRFDGATDFLQASAALMRTSFTLFYVWANTDNESVGGILESVNSGTLGQRIIVFGDTRAATKRHANYAPDVTDRFINNDADLAQATFYIGLLRANGTTVQGWRNGVSQGTASQAGSTTGLNTITIGKQSLGPLFFKGDLAAVLEIDSALGTSAINNVGNLLAERYGLTWTNINP